MLAIAIPHRGDNESHDEPDGDEGGDAEEIAGHLGSLLGVPEDKQGEFADMLHAYVKACTSAGGEDSKDDDHEREES